MLPALSTLYLETMQGDIYLCTIIYLHITQLNEAIWLHQLIIDHRYGELQQGTEPLLSA